MPGSGKSTLAERLSAALGMKRYYIGAMRREIARRRGMTLEQFNRLGETDPSTDREVDEYQVKLAKREDNIIIEGRTSFFLVPDSLKIFVDVDFNEGCARILKELQDTAGAGQRNETGAKTLDGLEASVRARLESDRLRYKKYYDMDDVYDRRHFDLVIDTTGRTPDETYEKALSMVRAAMNARAGSTRTTV